MNTTTPSLCFALMIASGLNCASAQSSAGNITAKPAQPIAPQYILESLPDRVATSRQLYRAEISAAAANIFVPEYVIVEAARRWPFDRTVRVAFRGGNDTLYAKLADAANEWISIGGANVKLRFRNAAGNFYQWSPSDVAYAGEIRIAFAAGKPSGGYWSHVGTDSKNAGIEGGAPNQPSMNLEAFDVALPPDWRSITIHEFGHALGFEHEHQNPQGGCDFKFEDDPGYKRATDVDGYFTTDAAGRKPGLYTYLSGKANYWDAAKTDRNLKTIATTSAFAVGPFDKFSVMKYFFNPDMFVAGTKSRCYTERNETLTLSAQDVAGVRRAYPSSEIEMEAINRSSIRALTALRDAPRASTRIQNTAAERLKSFK